MANDLVSITCPVKGCTIFKATPESARFIRVFLCDSPYETISGITFKCFKCNCKCVLSIVNLNSIK